MLLLKRILPYFALLLITTQTTLATPTPADYGALPAFDHVAISPNGDLIAYRSVSDGKDLIIVHSISQKKNLLVLDASTTQPRYIDFFNDDQLSVIVSQYTRMQGFLGKFDLSTAYSLNIKDKKFRQLLVPGERIYPAQTGLGKVVGMASDKKSVFMPAYADINNLIPETTYDLFKVDLERKHMTVAVQGSKNTKDYLVDKDGNPVAMEELNDRTNIHRIIAKKDDKWVEIFSQNTSIRTKNFVGTTPDSKSLVFIESNEENNHQSYNFMSLEDGKITNSNFAREDADIADVITDAQRIVYGVVYDGFMPSYKFFDPVLDKRVSNILAQFPEHSVFLNAWTPDWNRIVFSVSGSSYADDYFLATGDQPAVFIAAGRPKIKPEDINPIGRITFTARDDLKIPTLLTIPRDKVNAMKNLPAIIYPHGGPASHDTVGFDYRAQAFASQGYIVIQPQFRGSTGFGNKHRDAGDGEWGKKMQDDITDAVKFFTKKGVIDPQRVCIVGASYGGYAALAGGAFTPELYKCVVSINGVSDLNDMLSYDRRKNGDESEAAAYWEMQLGKGDVNRKNLTSASPYKFAQQFTAPVLLIKSLNDSIVSPSQSDDMYSALHKNNKIVQLVELKGDNHYLQKGPTRTQAIEETVKFVNQYLK